MIRHIVLLRFKTSVTEADKAAIYQKLADLQPLVEGMQGIEYGANISPENISRGFEDGFIVTFASAASRDAYLVLPEHQVTGAELVSMLEGGVDGLLVFDLNT